MPHPRAIFLGMIVSKQYAIIQSNKTGSHQCTPAVCSTFTEIQSPVTPRCIDALFGVPFQSLAQSRKGNPDSSPPVQSPGACLKHKMAKWRNAEQFYYAKWIVKHNKHMSHTYQISNEPGS